MRKKNETSLPENFRETYNKYARGKTKPTVVYGPAINAEQVEAILNRETTTEVIEESKTEVIEINVLDLKLMTKRFLSNEYHLTDKQLRSVEFKYMIRDGKFSGIKCEYKK